MYVMMNESSHIESNQSTTAEIEWNGMNVSKSGNDSMECFQVTVANVENRKL